MDIPSLKERKLERILGNLEKMIGSALLMLVGIISYWFVNYEKFSDFQFVLFFVGLAFLACVLLLLIIVYWNYFSKLYDREEERL